jgi:hypothetical protein
MIPNRFKYQSQNYRLLQALNYGPITTGQLLYELKFGSHVRRMKDVKTYLNTIGYTIVKKSIGNHCYEYRLAAGKPIGWWAYIKNLFQQRQTHAIGGLDV